MPSVPRPDLRFGKLPKEIEQALEPMRRALALFSTAAAAALNKSVVVGDTLQFETRTVEIQGDETTRITELVAKAGDTMTGELSAPTIRATSGADVSLSSTNHAFQTGPTSGVNIAIDGNEIQARNNGAASDLFLNLGGGTVQTGGPINPVGGITVNGWTNATLSGLWSNVGGGWAVAAYRKDPMGLVHLKGRVQTGAYGTTVFTLPVGYRPAENMIFAGHTDGGANRIQITTAGVITFLGGSGAASIDGITFKAA